MPSISFLILTYNSSQFIGSLFDSILAKIGNELTSGKYEVIIFDNASTDGSFGQTKNYFKDKEKFEKAVKFYGSEKNLGYAGGINKAAAKATGKLLIVINPDSELEDVDFNKIEDEFENNNRPAIAGLRLLSFDGSKERSAGKFLNALTFAFFALGLENFLSLRFLPDKKQKVDYVSGGFVVFRKEIFDKLGGYDEEYFMYVEDMDICYRAKKLGYDTYYLPYATIKHRGQGSSNREFAIVNIYKGLQIFYQKHSGLMNVWYIKNLLAAKAATIIFLGTVLNKREMVATYLKALKTIS